MKAVNLHLITRIQDARSVSLLLRELSERADRKDVSVHEAATLCALADKAAAFFSENDTGASRDWVRFLDGFYFSYIIEHIGKEFDLLKISADGSCVLNIELKSEQVDEERIKKQLEQNRYYLAHIAHTIWSFTYVMETDTLFVMNDRGFLRECDISELADVLMKDTLKDYMADGISHCFRAADYLISPIASPEKFLQEKYFLTNQQFDFRRRILSCLAQYRECGGALPVISISGIAGTGKTLLLLDLAMQLSKKHRVLFVHAGPLRQGHLTINSRLKTGEIRGIGQPLPADTGSLEDCSFLLIDEADNLEPAVLKALLRHARLQHLPVILAYDPHQLLAEAAGEEELSAQEMPSEVLALIMRECTLSLSFSGNIRINRPVYAFLRTLLNLKDRPGNPDYRCVDVLYANDREECGLLTSYFRNRGYELLSTPDSAIPGAEADIIAREYDKVLIILDERYYYDEALHLRVRENEGEALRLIYEGLSRTRENLCLLIAGNRDLFEQIIRIRLGE